MNDLARKEEEVQIPSTLNVVINSPEKLVWEGRANSVSSKNSTGQFDVLPGHANFVTMIENEPILIRVGEKEERFQYENAVLSVQGGNITIYAEI